MTTPATPRTRAGRALLASLSPTFVIPKQPYVKREGLLADILAIEAEAALAATPRPTSQEYAEQLRAFNAEVKRKGNAHDALLAALRALVEACDESGGSIRAARVQEAFRKARALLRQIDGTTDG